MHGACGICPDKSWLDRLEVEPGLYAACHLNILDFWETLAKGKDYVNYLSIQRWTYCFPRNEGVSSLNLSRGSIGLSANLDAMDARKGRHLVGNSPKTMEESYAST